MKGNNDMKQLSMLTLSACLVGVFGLSGCATMNAEDCQNANWELIGMKDGEQGELLSTFGDYAQQCREFGIDANRALYEKGRTTGLSTFCTKDNGFYQGKRNKVNNSVCPGKAQTRFNEGYAIGQEYFVLNQEISTLESRIRSNLKATEKLVKKLSKQKEQIAQQEDKNAATNKYLDDYATGQKKIAQWEVQIDLAKQELAVKKYQYGELVKQYGYQ